MRFKGGRGKYSEGKDDGLDENFDLKGCFDCLTPSIEFKEKHCKKHSRTRLEEISENIPTK